jgi:hypothetical protein
VAISWRVNSKYREDAMAVKYIGCCIDLNGEHIQDMIDASKEITAKTFRKKIGGDEYRTLEQSLHYDNSHGSKLRLATDFHVLFSKSVYRGKPCVYCTWSSIEHIFTLE